MSEHTEVETKKEAEQKPEQPKSGKPIITYDDFAKLDLRVALVENASRVEGADKLLKLELKVGEEKRTIVSGIFPDYSPEQMVGKKIVIIFNLAPRKIRGLESNGMLLAAGDGTQHIVLTPDREIADGSIVS